MGSSRILLVGGTGEVGRSVTAASARLGHPTFLLVRDPSPSDPAKAAMLDSFQKAGVTLLKGDLTDYESLIAAVKQVDIVISVVGRPQILQQLKLLEAIKEVGTIKRFIPSEFGNYADNKLKILHEVIAKNKAVVADAVKKSGVPYTFVVSGAGAHWCIDDLWQNLLTGAALKSPPRDKVKIWADGNAKAVLINEDDIGTYTILAVEDPRAENKTLYVRPPGVYLSQNEIVALWEQKIGHTLEKTYVPDEELVKTIEESPYPMNLFIAINYGYLVQGYKPDLGTNGVEAFTLWPNVKYMTTSEYLDRFV
ncbi:unnamed protein product [Calypogeia fissa]